MNKLSLSVKNIHVAYPKKTVLKGVSTEFKHSQIHMLIGENGAGKSTLTKVICGDILPASGELFLNNQKISINTPHDAIEHGIVCVHQRPLLSESISIMENLRLGVKKFNRQKAETLLKQWLPDAKPSTLVKNCGGDTRFFISLTGALLKNPEILILDEPGALLDLPQREFLFARLKSFASEGMNIIVITHYMNEAEKYGDTITCLEDGTISSRNEIPHPQQLEKLTAADDKDTDNFYLRFTDINCTPLNKPKITDFSFMAEAGKITLICGQVEDGRETLEDFICGMSQAKQRGTLTIKDKEREFSFKIKNENFTRRKLEKSPFTFGIIPSNKTFRGSNPKLSIFQLLTANCGLKTNQEQLEFTQQLIQKADVNITPQEKAVALSGGMLQRLILEREISRNPDILILCEPVQGLDYSSTNKLCQRLQKIASEGKIVLVLSSSEFPKEICSTIYELEKL